MDFAIRARSEHTDDLGRTVPGLPRHQALLLAARVRLRPILMTTLAMIFGMVPLAFALSEGAEMRAPMGQAVIGGVITSSLLTLVVVATWTTWPIAYAAGPGPRRPCHPGKIARTAISAPAHSPRSTSMHLHNVEQARFNMIEQQIRPWDVADASVLQLLSLIKRENFVPAAYRTLAFVDMCIPLAAGQSMLPPRIQARLLQDAAVQPGDKVLEIGAGSGYMTAMLAHLAQRVVAIEIEPELADMARANLQACGVRNAEVRQGDGAAGAAADGPFDVIMLGGSVVEVPQALLAQLKVGGRLVAIVGSEPIMHAQVITRTSDSNYKVDEKWDDNAAPLRNFPAPCAFRF